MSQQIYLAADLGAESGRVMAGLWDGRTMRLEELHRFPNASVWLGDTFRWDVLRLWNEIQHGLTIAAKKYGKDVRSVGVDTWGVDFTLLSKSGELLGLPFVYRDARTKGMLNAACQRVPRAEIYGNTGIQFMEINTLYQLLALQQQSPELLAAADTLLTIPDFLNFCLSGAKVGELSIASTTQCFDPRTKNWAFDLLKRFELPTRIFPQIVAPGTRLGKLRAATGERTGLGQIEVVAPATHDTGSAVAAVPVTGSSTNWAYLSSGTWSLLGVETTEPQLSAAALAADLTNEGGVDGTWRVLKNVMGLWLVQQCRKTFEARGGTTDYGQLVKLAEAAPALRSLVDPNDARFLNPPDMTKAIADFCRETGQPVPESEGAFVRCALESLALKYDSSLRGITAVTGRAVDTIHIVGGGSRNQLLNQLTADATGCRVVAGPVEATALGNLLTQARAFGEIASLSDLRGVVRASSEVTEFTPNPAAQGQWQAARARFAQLEKKK